MPVACCRRGSICIQLMSVQAVQGLETTICHEHTKSVVCVCVYSLGFTIFVPTVMLFGAACPLTSELYNAQFKSGVVSWN